MAERSIIIEHNGVKYTGHIATIKSTRLGYEDHGILTTSLDLSWEGAGVGFGGYCLDERRDRKSSDYTRVGTAYGLDHIIRVMETVGVDRWEKLQGSRVIALFDYESSGSTLGGMVRGIAALQDDKVFIPSEHADAWREKSAVA
jgi:hypothetical protein